MTKTQGQIIKAVGGTFTVRVGENAVECKARGKIKLDKSILVGDFVEVEDNVVERVLPRKNFLVRPPVANVDLLVIVVAALPKADWLLVEKLLLNCHAQKIDAILCYNKADLESDEAIAAFLRTYAQYPSFVVSAKTGANVAHLRAFLKGKLVCFAGQSAVGKSSIINALGGKCDVGELSKRVGRGKNTTRRVEIIDLGDFFLMDTCGFSDLDGIDITHSELIYYYDEFLAYQDKCKFRDCTHTNEPDCAVKKAVAEGKIDRARYERYKKLFEKLKESWEKKYD